VSNQLSIAAATATLRYILHPAMDIVPGAQVTTVRPDHLGKSKLTKGVNVYLYRITPLGAAMGAYPVSRHKWWTYTFWYRPMVRRPTWRRSC
jgi:hypothetical protein